jgi:hypothetical protein
MVKVIHAGSASTSSFEEASQDLLVLAEVNVSAKRIGRLVTRIGHERIAEIEQQAQAYEKLPLPVRRQSPIELTPELVCVQVDGGRLQIRDRKTPASANDESDSSFWRESKVGALLKMQGKVYEEDPCPELPAVFVNPQRISRLTREIKGFSGDRGEHGENETSSASVADESLLSADELHASTRPEPLVRSVVASTKAIGQFGPLLAGQAYQRGFMGAKRKAFVCDGMACNWTLQEKHFSRFTPILDFVHAICYIYHAAVGGDPSPEAWQRYCQWAQWLWSGKIQQLLEEMEAQQKRMGEPQENDSDSSPRQLLADAIRYVTNQQSRMKYADYRREGLPITSAYIESTIKQVNRRVKGTEKFWSINADPMLQLRADVISETQALEKFWERRPKHLPSFTHYKMAG